MPVFGKYADADFSNLEELVTQLHAADIVVAHGVYDKNYPNPGSHVSIKSPSSHKLYDFIKKDDTTYILRVGKT